MLLTRNMFLLSTATLFIAAALNGCQSQLNTTDDSAVKVTQVNSQASNYLSIELGAQSYQLITTASQLQLKQGNKVLAQLDGKFSRLKLHQPEQGEALVAAIDTDSNSLYLWQLNTAARTPLTLLQQQLISSRVVEDLCFYHSSENQQLSLFLLGDRGGADQLLLQQQQHWLAQPLTIRELNVPYDSTACAVDASEGALYIAEADRAIWRYQAEPEADEGRSLLQVKQPFGQLQGEIKALAVLADSSVLALEEEPARLLRLTTDGQVLSATLLKDMAEASNLSLRQMQLDTQAYVSSEAESSVQQISIKLNAAQVKSKAAMVQLMPTLQTDAASQRGDVMDDPAVWHHLAEPSQSLILATDKRAGLDVYNMRGQKVQQLAVGRLNNVDVRYGMNWQGKPHDIAAASLRDNNSIQLFAIDSSGTLHEAGQVATAMSDIYGLCMYQGQDNSVYVFVNDKSGLIEQYRIESNSNSWQGSLVRTLEVPTQPEGCVADDKTAELFVGEEDAGIWRFAADASASNKGEQIILVDGERLVDDVEGLALAQHGDRRYLVVSSQGNDSYVVYDATAPFAERLRFRVTTNSELEIDGASETDGLEVTTRSLGPGFEQGALIVQDGRNRMPEQGQNLKLVPWQQILLQLK